VELWICGWRTGDAKNEWKGDASGNSKGACLLGGGWSVATAIVVGLAWEVAVATCSTYRSTL
jgi:hypothetical protein